jgi:hypothetical protein
LCSDLGNFACSCAVNGLSMSGKKKRIEEKNGRDRVRATLRKSVERYATMKREWWRGTVLTDCVFVARERQSKEKG